MTDWDTLIASPSYLGKRIFLVAVDGRRYWVKRAPGGDTTALRNEVRAMCAVAKRGVLVPTVVYQSDGSIVMTDLGQTLQRHLEQSGARERMRCAVQVGDVLSELHRKAGWHGNAALRNLMHCGGRIGMIDFETETYRWMPLTARQAFDAWQVIHSLAQFDERDALIGAFLARYRSMPGVLAWLRRAAWLASPIYLLLVPFTRYLKRDFRQGVYGLRALLASR